MKAIYWIFIFFVSITTIYAQDKTSTNKTNKEEEWDIIGARPEIPPVFRGGFEALQKWLSSNIRYPKTATKSGNVYVQFTIKNNGKITNAVVLKGLEPVLDNEALRVIRMMPAWTPATMNGKPIVMRYNLPIKFRAK